VGDVLRHATAGSGLPQRAVAFLPLFIEASRRCILRSSLLVRVARASGEGKARGLVQGAVSGDAPMGAWPVLSATLLHPLVSSSWDYSLFIRHRLFAARLAVPEGSDGSGNFCQPPPFTLCSGKGAQ
jgi:hypothetical protein